jgi:ABC-type branched-subunit amino acid transport system ATPase component
VVLDQGRVVHQNSAQTLASQPELLDQLLGVART